MPGTVPLILPLLFAGVCYCADHVLVNLDRHDCQLAEGCVRFEIGGFGFLPSCEHDLNDWTFLCRL